MEAGFSPFADLHAWAGVRQHRISSPVDDANYVVIDLDFDTANEARAFLETLREKVWPSRENAPALLGASRTQILETVESGDTPD